MGFKKILVLALVLALATTAWGQAIHNIKVYPAQVVMNPGQTIDFTCVAFGPDQTMFSPSFVSWQATGGTIGRQGKYHAPNYVGEFVVTATVGQFTDSTRITVKISQPTITRIVVTPKMGTVQVGGKFDFNAVAYDGYGNVVPVRFDWRTNGGGTINDNNGVFRATTPGHFNVSAHAGNVYDTAQIHVFPAAPAISRLVVTPAVSTLQPGQSYQFRATAYNTFGQVVPCNTTWAATGGTMQPQTGMYTAGFQAGAFTVWAVDGATGVRGEASVTIVGITPPPPAPFVFSITPSSNVRLQTGQTYQFTGTLTRNGRPMPCYPVWSVNGGGHISESGMFTAGHQPGNFQISATERTSGLTAAVTIHIYRGHTPPPPPVEADARIVVEKWEVHTHFGYYRIKANAQVFGSNIQTVRLFAVSGGNVDELQSFSCSNESRVKFDAKASMLNTKHLEIRLYNNMNQLVARTTKNL